MYRMLNSMTGGGGGGSQEQLIPRLERPPAFAEVVQRCTIYTCCGHTGKVGFLFLRLNSGTQGRGPFFWLLLLLLLAAAINRRRILQMPLWLLCDGLVYRETLHHTTDVLPPLPIKVQVVMAVWHSLSTWSFAGLAPDGSPPQDGRKTGCVPAPPPPCLPRKAHFKPQSGHRAALHHVKNARCEEEVEPTCQSWEKPHPVKETGLTGDRARVQPGETSRSWCAEAGSSIIK